MIRFWANPHVQGGILVGACLAALVVVLRYGPSWFF